MDQVESASEKLLKIHHFLFNMLKSFLNKKIKLVCIIGIVFLIKIIIVGSANEQKILNTVNKANFKMLH